MPTLGLGQPNIDLRIASSNLTRVSIVDLTADSDSEDESGYPIRRSHRTTTNEFIRQMMADMRHEHEAAQQQLRHELEAAQQQLNNFMAANTCILCMDKPNAWINTPCGHYLCCLECEDQVRSSGSPSKCYQCNKPLKKSRTRGTMQRVRN